MALCSYRLNFGDPRFEVAQRLVSRQFTIFVRGDTRMNSISKIVRRGCYGCMHSHSGRKKSLVHEFVLKTSGFVYKELRQHSSEELPCVLQSFCAIGRGKKGGRKGERKRSGILKGLGGLEGSGKSKRGESPRKGRKGGRKVEGSQSESSRGIYAEVFSERRGGFRRRRIESRSVGRFWRHRR